MTTPPFHDTTVHLGPLQTRWRESGHAACGTVLMLHSLGLDCEAFDGLRAELAQDWRLVSYDMPGHGQAAAHPVFDLVHYVDAAQAALAACGEATVHLVGHSMGGAVAASLAGRLPGRVASLSLLATPAAGVPGFVERGQLALAHGMEGVVADTLRRWFGEAPAPGDAAAMAYARAALRAMRAEGFAGAWQALAGFAGYRDLALHLPPTLLMAADDDLSTPAQTMQHIADAFAQAQVPQRVQMLHLPAAGHMVLLTAPGAVAAGLERHWRTHTPDGYAPNPTATHAHPLPTE